jgi:hypothetical protein
MMAFFILMLASTSLSQRVVVLKFSVVRWAISASWRTRVPPIFRGCPRYEREKLSEMMAFFILMLASTSLSQRESSW